VNETILSVQEKTAALPMLLTELALGTPIGPKVIQWTEPVVHREHPEQPRTPREICGGEITTAHTALLLVIMAAHTMPT